MKKFNTLVVSAFAGTGKTTLCSNDNLEVLDMDSALFDKADFPENYMRELRHELDKGEYRYIFVSTHASMRAAMAKENINFVLVYPRRELKEEYRKRYIGRNSPHEFVESIMKNWEDMLDNCSAQEDCIHTILESGEYLEDRFLMSSKTKAQASSSRYSLTIDGHSDLSSQKDSGDGSEDDEAKEKQQAGQHEGIADQILPPAALLCLTGQCVLHIGPPSKKNVLPPRGQGAHFSVA